MILYKIVKEIIIIILTYKTWTNSCDFEKVAKDATDSETLN